MKETSNTIGCDLANGLSTTSGTISITNGSTITTTTTGNNSGIYIWSGNSFTSIYSLMDKIYILGDYIECSQLSNIDINIIATLNVLGESYWVELKRLNGHDSLAPEVIEFIEKRIKIERRNKKIDNIL